MKKFSERTQEERRALAMMHLWEAELMFLEHPDSNDEYWSSSNRDMMLEEHKKEMEKEGLESAAK